MNEETIGIESIIAEVGNDGKYQRRFSFLFNFLLALLASMPNQNFINALAIPDHWCFVPGREFTNYSLNEWKHLHLPKEIDSAGILGFSKCNMYNGSYHIQNVEIIKCQYGWEYDKTWYEMTIPMQESWVCDDGLQVTNTFMFSKLGEVVGTFIFGQLADSIGRRPVFFMSVVIVVFGRMLLIFTSYSATLFFLAMCIGSSTSSTVLFSTYVTSMEISKRDSRARIAMIHCIGGTLGFCVLPLIMWLLNDWRYFMAATTLPCLLYVFSGKFLIESPRWLISKGNIKKCVKELNKIAKVNGTELPEDASYLLTKVTGDEEKVYGMFGLFSSWRLTKNTLLIISGWSTTSLIYYTLTFNVTNLEGNPFLNFFWQGMAEFPALFIGKYASDRYGRRWTNMASFLATIIGCIPILFIIHDESQQLTVAAFCVFLKFCNAFAYYIVNLQAMEIYPTCVRQTGMSLGGIVANAVGVFGPYVVFLGIEIDASYPYILSVILGAVGVFSGFFLPETLNQSLPETLSEAAVFGANQNYCGKEKKQEPIDEFEMTEK
ncbi:PREDICTED: organic cation transporter protein-like [Nicrophorus vespilloides]|uniref:Organic cation transporter protein-like n=1 Tax=Nicrophorus vespilloides TaxID=110193 RepID=A0ABM1NKG0_NICVS|nr:PREDICTED: organic cation transporter protein-like [Nicrophorus vespilloides]